MKIIFLVLIIAVFAGGCSKMQEKKPEETNKGPVEKSTNTTSNTPMQNTTGEGDDKAATLVKEADEAIGNYEKNKTDALKDETVAKTMAAANYLMLEANLPAKEKYRPALKYYRKVLELDPKNEEALKNKKQIEDIYESMGMPIPQ